jgi:DNA-directed RNA polymerase specialized sigma24 family protein
VCSCIHTVMAVRRAVSDRGEETSGWGPPLVAVYRRCYAEFVRLAYLMTGSREAAQDIVQDSFVSARRSWDGVRDPEPYIRAIIVNGCRGWSRRQVREQGNVDPGLTVTDLGADELWDSLGVLKPRQRAAIVLRFYADLPDDEIADLLNCRRATVRTAIHRGLSVLRREVRP